MFTFAGIMAILMPVLKTLVATAATALIGVGVDHVRKKTKIMITDDFERKLNVAARDAINYAEEISMSKLSNGNEPNLSSDVKLEIATDYALNKLGDISKDVVQDKIHSKLAFEGMGATAKRSVSITK